MNLVQDFSSIVLVKQQYDWDCGLACVEMLLKTASIRTSFTELHNRINNIKSPWTIDIAMLLQSYDLSFVFFTTMKGVCPEYEDFGFYSEEFGEDKIRVVKQFERAEATGINIMEKRLLIEDLFDHVQEHKNFAIILVDSNIIRSCALEENKKCASISYYGHYIFLYDANLTDEGSFTFMYADPYYGDKYPITGDLLNRARGAKGTDDDVLLISYKT